MIEIIKQASQDLHSFDNNIVKVAGVLRRLQNWFSSLGNPEYRKQIENLRNESIVVNENLTNLSKHINLLQSAIKDADINSYEKELEEVKFLSKQLTDELEKLNYTVESVKVPEEKPVESKNRAGYDVPVGSVNKAYKSFEHFNQIPADLIVVNDAAKSRALLNVNTKLKRLKFDDQVELLNNNSDSFFTVLKEAITNGIVLENTVVSDAKKERPSGQMYVKVRTAPFSVPGLNLKIQGVALLTDLYAQKSPRMKLSLMRFTDIEIEKIASAKERVYLLKKIAQSYVGPGFVQKRTTSLSGQQLAQVLIDTYKKVFGKEPTLQTLGTAWAQSMFEQRGNYINNNLGNITAGQGWINSGGKYFVHETHNDQKNGYKEFDANGNVMQNLDHVKYRAYDTPEEGGEDYWRQLGTTFKDALAWFGTGDALHAGLALGDKTYYTANRIIYSGNMASLYEEFLTKIAPNLNLINNPTLPPSRSFPEYKAFKNSPKQEIPENSIEKINKNTAYKIVNDENKQYVVLNDRPNQNTTENANTQVAQNNTTETTPDNDIDTEVNDLMNYLFKSGEPLTDIVKKALEDKLLPKTKLLISIASVDSFNTKVKYATILSEVLDKNIDSQTEILSNGNDVNVNCIASGENDTVINAVLAIAEVISDGFYINNGKIVKSILKPNQMSKLASISYEELDRSMRICELEELI